MGFLFDLFKQQIDGIFVILVVFTDIHHIQHIQQDRKVLLSGQHVVMHIPDQCGQQKGFSL